MSAAAQAAEGLCLKFPNELGIHREITLEQAVLMLGRATTMAATMPFQWGFIDQPKGMPFIHLDLEMVSDLTATTQRARSTSYSSPARHPSRTMACAFWRRSRNGTCLRLEVRYAFFSPPNICRVY